jgi:tetratricopeptide (TPR) repeat protein
MLARRRRTLMTSINSVTKATVGLFFCFWALAASAQQSRWEEAIAAGKLARQNADYSGAEKHFSNALKEAENFEASDPRLAESLASLAGALRISGKYAAAEPLYKRVLALQEVSLGANSSEVAADANNLAVLYYDEDHYAQAEPLYERALGIWENTLGPESSRVAGCAHDLGMVFHG